MRMRNQLMKPLPFCEVPSSVDVETLLGLPRREPKPHPRLVLCMDCPHFHDSVETGEPIDPPCKLAPHWRIGGCGCKVRRELTWRGRMVMNEPHPHKECPWNLEKLN